MKLSSLSNSEIRQRLGTSGLRLSVADFEILIRSSLSQISDGLSLLYADYPLGQEAGFTDFELCVDAPSMFRRLVRPQVNFSCNDFFPFKPLPIGQAFAMFEWGLNWVIANHCHQFAVIHSAVVEKNGKGLIMPGTPGSGKSTLCAGLVCKGWRLLSDEMALISLKTNQIHPFPRPIGLKNNSIAIIQEFGNNVVFGETASDTAKGSVAHMRAPEESVEASQISAPPFAVIFPRYQPDAELNFAPIGKGETMMKLAENCFNYPVLGTDGFHCLTNVAELSSGHTLSYSKLDDAIGALDILFGDSPQ